MGAGSVQLDEVVVTAKAITESETALLMVQKKSIQIKQSIGAQELSRKGLGDADFDAVMENLGATLQELNVPGELIAEAAAIAESTRNDILGR